MPIKPDRPSPSEQPAHLISIDQLDSAGIRGLCENAARFRGGMAIRPQAFSAGLLFLQPSLRTRLGFAEAILRLGGTSHIISSLREISDGTVAETLNDTLRVVTGMTGVAIVRTDGRLADHIQQCRTPIINAGDGEEHPTQALIDLFAMQQICGPWQNLTVGVSGDLTMRATRSLFKAFAKDPPKRLAIMAPSTRQGDAQTLLEPVKHLTEWREGGDWRGLDVLHLGGLPTRRGADHLDAAQRERFALTGANIGSLPAHARVFSPMPVIDEISAEAKSDPRVAIFDQSDLGIYIRMAIVQGALNWRP